MKRRGPARVLPVLVALAVLSSACTISVFSDDHDHADPDQPHDHAEEDESHDHGEGGEGEVRIDHHGNPIYDEEERVYEAVTAEGVTVEFTVENFIGVGGRGGELAPRLVEGEHANLQFHVTDSATGEELGGLRPAVWLDVASSDVACGDRVQGYLSGGLEARPLVDLNSYFILGMNRDNTISVINPLIDVGGMTNLFSVILLQATPQDWAMTPNQTYLFVTLPDVQSVAAVDLNAFLVEDTVELPAPPQRVAIQPGGERAWVTLGGSGGLAIIDTETLEVETLDTGGPTGPIAFSPDGARAVIGTDSGAIIFDTAGRTETGRVTLAGTPAAADVSAATGDAYLVVPDTGHISVLDLDRGVERERLAADPGLADVGVSPDGRFALAVSPDTERAFVVETAGNQITHVFPAPGVPDQVTFTDDAAYIHMSGAPAVTVVPLAEIDPAGDVAVLNVPIGFTPPRSVPAPVVADALTPTPDGDAVLIANPSDDTVYFYTEGSEAALGGFQGHTLRPRAVQVVDRSLKEPSPGVYTGSIRIPQSGDFVVPFLLDDPGVVHCFGFTARSAEDPVAGVATTAAEVEILSGGTPVAGEQHQLQFELREQESGSALTALEDVLVMLVQAGGSWNERFVAAPAGDAYAVTFTPPAPGIYTAFFTVPSLGLDFESLGQHSLQVSAP